MQFSKKIVTLIILMNIAFTAVVFYVFLRTGSEPAALVGCWFAFTTGELWALSKIKQVKIKEGKNERELETEVEQPEILDGSGRVCDRDPGGL